MPTAAHTFAVRILQRYPGAWRERYETEVRALLDDVPARWRDVAELFRGMLAERARELLSADDKPRRTAFVLAVLKPLLAVAAVAASTGIGLLLYERIGAWTDEAKTVGQWALLIFVVVAPIMLFRLRRRPYSYGAPPYDAWVGAVMVPCVCAAIAIATWGDLLSDERSPDRQIATLTQWYMWWIILPSMISHLASSIWPTNRMLDQFNRLEASQAWLKEYEQMAAASEEWIARGVPSPLAEARDQVAHWTRERDEAREQLHALGYRARLTRPAG